MKLNNMGWGMDRRKAFPIPPEILAAIKRGDNRTDYKYAKELGYKVGSVRNIRLRRRRA